MIDKKSQKSKLTWVDSKKKSAHSGTNEITQDLKQKLQSQRKYQQTSYTKQELNQLYVIEDFLSKFTDPANEDYDMDIFLEKVNFPNPKLSVEKKLSELQLYTINLFNKVYVEILGKDFFYPDFNYNRVYKANKTFEQQIIDIGDLLVVLTHYSGPKIKGSLKEAICNQVQGCIQKLSRHSEAMLIGLRKDTKGLCAQDRRVLEQAFYTLIMLGYAIHCVSKKDQSEVYKRILHPLMALISKYEIIFFDSTQPFMLKRKVASIQKFYFLTDSMTFQDIEEFNLTYFILMIFQQMTQKNQNLKASMQKNSSSQQPDRKALQTIIDLAMRKQILYYMAKKEGSENECSSPVLKEKGTPEYEQIDEQDEFYEEDHSGRKTGSIEKRAKGRPLSNEMRHVQSQMNIEVSDSPRAMSPPSPDFANTRVYLTPSNKNTLQAMDLSPSDEEDEGQDQFDLYGLPSNLKQEERKEFTFGKNLNEEVKTTAQNLFNVSQDIKEKESAKFLAYYQKDLPHSPSEHSQNDLLHSKSFSKCKSSIINQSSEFKQEDTPSSISNTKGNEAMDKSGLSNETLPPSHLMSQKAQEDLKYNIHIARLLADQDRILNDITKQSLIYASDKLSMHEKTQQNWVRLSCLMLEISQNMIDNFQMQSDAEYNRFHCLWLITFDLFKVTLYFVSEKKMYSPFQNITSSEDGIREIPNTQVYRCYLNLVFQTMFKMINPTTNPLVIQSFYSEYIQLAQSFAEGHFNEADEEQYLKIYYMLFFNSLQFNNSELDIYLRMSLHHFLKLFSSFYYFEHYIKEFENMQLMARDYEKLALKIKNDYNNGKEFQILNKAIVQSLAIEIISSICKNSEIIIAQFWKDFDATFMSHHSLELNESKLYQQLKLALAVLSYETITSPQIYKILMEDEKTCYCLYNPWVGSRKVIDLCVKPFWGYIIDRILTYFQKATGPNESYQVTKLSEKKVNKNSNKVNEHSFNLYSHFMLYVTSCQALCNYIMDPLKEKFEKIVSEKMIKSAQHRFQLMQLLIALSRNALYATPAKEKITIFTNCLVQCVRYFTEQVGIWKREKNDSIYLGGSRRIDRSISYPRAAGLKRSRECAETILSVIENYVRLQILKKKKAKEMEAGTFEKLWGIKGSEFEIFTYQYFYRDILQTIKRALILEGSLVENFIDEIMKIYFFQKEESQHVETNSEGEVSFQSNQNFNIRTLDYLFGILVEVIDSNHPKTSSLLIKVVRELYMKIVLDSNIFLIKFAKSLTVDIIKNVKKIFIYLRENDHLQDFGNNWKDLFIHALEVICNPVILKEYFSFMREIFYYSQDMDQVDYQLILDMIDSYNQLLLSYKLVRKDRGQQIFVSDYYHFSNMTKGIILAENFKVKDSFTVACLFKVNQAQLKEALDNAKAGYDKLHTMGLLGFYGRDQDENRNNFILFQSNIDYFKIYEQEIFHKDQWHFLMVKFKQMKSGLFQNYTKYKVSIYIDELKNPLTEVSMTFTKNAEYILYQGCHMTGLVQTRMESEHVFQGQMSLLFFFEDVGFSKEGNEMEAEIHKQCFIELVSRKQILYLKQGNLQSLIEKMGKQDQVRKNIKTEFQTINDINEKMILRHRELCLYGYLGAVHAKMPYQQLVALGGFKLLYPIFEKSLQSNLDEFLKANIWRQLFKVLKTIMNVEVGHTLRLFSNRYLIEILKRCLIRGAKKNIMTKDVLKEVYEIINDINTNKNAHMLKEFYKGYLLEILMNYQFCMESYSDVDRKKSVLILNHLIDFLYIFVQDSKLIQHDRGEQAFIRETIFSQECYNNMFEILKSVSSPKNLDVVKKIGRLMVELTLQMSHKEGLVKMVNIIQRSQNQINKVYLWILLKIVYKVFIQSAKNKMVSEVYSSLFNYGYLFQHLSQFNKNFGHLNSDPVDDDICDRIIVETLKLVQHGYAVRRLQQAQRSFIANNPKQQQQTEKVMEEERARFYSRLSQWLLQNQRLHQKAFLALIYSSFKIYGEMVNNKAKLNCDNLVMLVQNKYGSIDLNSDKFDPFMYRITLSCVNLFIPEIKQLFFNQFNWLIDKKIHQITEIFLQDEEQISNKDSLPSIRSHFYCIMEQVMQQPDQTIIDYFEYIASNLVIQQLINSYDKSGQPHLIEVDKKGMLLVNRILIMYDQSKDTQMKIISRLLSKVIEFLMEHGKSISTHLKMKLNLKLIVFLQFIEELYIRKEGSIIHDSLFLPILAKFLLIFEMIGLLSFDYPYRPLFDDAELVVTNPGEFLEKQKQADIAFIEGGPLRIFISLLMQCLNQFQSDEDKFATSLELTRFLILNEQSPFIDALTQDLHLSNKYVARETLCVLEQPLKLLKCKPSQLAHTIYEQMKVHMQVHATFKQSMVQTPAFITLFLMGELYELITISIANLSSPSVTKSLLTFLFDICFVTYQNPDQKMRETSSLTEMFFYITDAQVKNDLFLNFDCIKKSKPSAIVPILLCSPLEQIRKQYRECSAMEMPNSLERSYSVDYHSNAAVPRAVRAFYFAQKKNKGGKMKQPAMHMLRKMESERQMDTGLIMSEGEMPLEEEEEKGDLTIHVAEYSHRDLITLNEEIQEELLQFLKDFFHKLQVYVQDTQGNLESENQLLELLQSDVSRRFFTTLPIITSTRFVDIIEQINESIERKIGRIKKEMEVIKNQKNSIDNLVHMQHYQTNMLRSNLSNTQDSETFSMQSSQRKGRELSTDSYQQQESLRAGLTKQMGGGKKTVHQMYIKKLYERMVKRMEEDESSIWYDHLEQMRKDYTDMKEVYKQVNVVKPKEQGEESKDEFGHRNEYSYFIRQRRIMDKWGRMMLIKPNRKYNKNKFWQMQAYFIHEFLKNIFALSFLDDQDFNDYLQNPSMAFDNESEGSHMGSSHMGRSGHQGQSETFKKIRELLMRKIENNGFLYKLFTQPHLVLDNKEETIFKEYKIEMGNEPNFQSLAQFVTVEGTYTGFVYLTKEYLMFQASANPIDGEKYRFALQMEQDMNRGPKVKIWRLRDLEEVIKRRFLLIYQAVEFYTFWKKSYFINLLDEDKCNDFFAKLEHFRKEEKHKMDIVISCKKKFDTMKYKQDWEIGDIQNQQLLMLVNKYSGRSFNDLRQYPIFPWVINDYKVDSKGFVEKMHKQEIFRDLTKNSATLSYEKVQIAKEIYKQNKEEDFQYGTDNYYINFGCSNILMCLRLLNRVEPFTSMHIKANNHMDEPDRTFKSMRREWKNILKEKQVNEELTPEFFYFPEIFRNHNLNHFGLSSKGVSVNDVKLPKWAKNEHDFVRIQREVLETEHVTLKLRCWLDLLFGAKQDDKACKNIYFSYAYEKFWSVKELRNSMDELKLVSAISSVREFMQVPQRLFNAPLDKEKRALTNEHSEEEKEENDDDMQGLDQAPIVVSPKQREEKKDIKEVTEKGLKTVGKLFDPDSVVKSYSILKHLMDAKTKQQLILDRVAEFHIIKDKQIVHMLFTQNAKCLVFEKQLNANGLLGVYQCRETFFKDDLKSKSDLNLKYDHLKGDLSCVFQEFSDKSQKNQCLYVGQNLDNTIKIYDFSKKKQMNLIYTENSHKNIVTAIKFSYDWQYFISGDADGEIRVYIGVNSQDLQMFNSTLVPASSPKPLDKNFPFILKTILQDQMSAILSIDINLVLDMFVTASSDGTLALRCLRSSRLLKIIPNSKLLIKHAQVVALKLSLHGYIVLVLKLKEFYTQFLIYSLNGELLCSQTMDRLEVKNVFLTKGENNILVAQNVRKAPNLVIGQVKVYKLFTLQKIQDLELKFYGNLAGQIIVNQNPGQPPIMPPVKTMAMSRNERTMNIYLERGEVFCFDINIVKVKDKLQDFGFLNT